MARETKRWTASRAREVLAAVAASGESIPSYAKRHGFDAQRLYAWRRKLAAERSRSSTPAFLAVRVADSASPAPVSRPHFELVVGGDRVVRVAPDFDAGALRRLVAVLEEGGQ